MTALHSPAYRRFAESLTAARHAKGLTQRQLGALLGKDHTYVTKYETRLRRVDVIEFLEIMEALGADPAAFLAELRGR